LNWLRLDYARGVLCYCGESPIHGVVSHRSQICFDELLPIAAADAPRLEPYARLALLYDAYTGLWCLRYDGYLADLSRYHDIPLNTALDLGCGCGALAARLAGRCSRVIGLDGNLHMLTLARARFGHLPNVEFIDGDFRMLDLHQQFDAIVCASDTLNYVASLDELTSILTRVAAHLTPRGILVCDVVSVSLAQALSKYFMHYESTEGRFVMASEFEPATRRSLVRVIFADGVEVHERISLRIDEVRSAANSAGLAVLEQFSGMSGRAFFTFHKHADG
jgi:SAM-dependent methyltransferase